MMIQERYKIFEQIYSNSKFLQLHSEMCSLFRDLGQKIKDQTFLLIVEQTKFKNLEKIKDIILHESYVSWKSEKDVRKSLLSIKTLFESYTLYISGDPELDDFIKNEIESKLEDLIFGISATRYAWQTSQKDDNIKNQCLEFKKYSDRFIDLISIWKDKINIPEKLDLES